LIGIKSFKDNILTVENLGGRPLAFSIKVNYADETSSLEEVNPVVWKNGSLYNKKIESKKEITSIQIKVSASGDAVNKNNILTIRK
jgi:hypothetical protein